MPTKHDDTAAETWVASGGAIKSLGDGRYRGPLVLFSTADDPDLTGDFFTKATDYRLRGGKGTSVVLYDHDIERKDAPSEFLGNPFKGKVIGDGEIDLDDIAAWLTFTIDLRGSYEERVAKQYERGFAKLIDAGKLGLSSGTAGHLTERELQPNGTTWIKRWPLGLDASLTPTPAEPRTTVMSLKSFAAKALDYDDSFRDGIAAQAAIESLSSMLISCIGTCFGWYDSAETKPPKADRLAKMRAEFEDFTDDSLAVIAALMDDDTSFKSLAFALKHPGQAASARPFRDMPPSVVSALKGFADLSRTYAEHRRDEGRSLGGPKRDAIQAVIDGASPLIAELKSLLAPPAKVAVESAANRLRLLALKHRHATAQT